MALVPTPGMSATFDTAASGERTTMESLRASFTALVNERKKFVCGLAAASLAALGLLAPSAAFSQVVPPSEGAAPSLAPQTRWVPAVVEKFDAARNKLVLRHGPIEALDMPAMVMAYTLATAWDASLDKGARIEFQPGRINGRFSILALRVVQAQAAAQ